MQHQMSIFHCPCRRRSIGPLPSCSYTVGPVSIPLSRHTYSLTDGWAWWSRICQNKAVHSIHCSVIRTKQAQPLANCSHMIHLGKQNVSSLNHVCECSLLSGTDHQPIIVVIGQSACEEECPWPPREGVAVEH